MADSTEKFLLKKKCDSASGKQVSGRRASCYSPQFKAQVVKFASRSTRDNTKKLFGIPDGLRKLRSRGELLTLRVVPL